MKKSLVTVLDMLEADALRFYSAEEWDLVKAEVLLNGSIHGLSKTATEALTKARRSFGSRSEAGRYAAEMRWRGSNEGGRAAAEEEAARRATAPKPAAQPSEQPATQPAQTGTKDLRTIQQEQIAERDNAFQRMQAELAQRRQERMAAEQAVGLGFASRPGTTEQYGLLSRGDLTPEQVKAYGAKGQTGSGNKLVEFTGPSGDKYLMGEGAYHFMRVEGGASTIKPKGKPPETLDANQIRAEAVEKLVTQSQAKIDQLTPTQLKAATVKPVGIVQASTTLGNNRQMPPKERNSSTDYVVLDRGGQTELVDARLFGITKKAFPNATVVMPESGKMISFLDGGRLVAAIMPIRNEGGYPSTEVFQSRAATAPLVGEQTA